MVRHPKHCLHSNTRMFTNIYLTICVSSVLKSDTLQGITRHFVSEMHSIWISEGQKNYPRIKVESYLMFVWLFQWSQPHSQGSVSFLLQNCESKRENTLGTGLKGNKDVFIQSKLSQITEKGSKYILDLSHHQEQ